MVLPASEGFAPDRAGAIALVVRRLAGAAGAGVIGRRNSATYPAIDYHPVSAGSKMFYALGVIRQLRAQRPDVIEIHQQPRLARLIARLFPSARVMLFIHNDPLEMRGLRRRAERARTLATLHRVICVSDYLRSRYALGIEPTSSLAVLPNPLTLMDLPAATVPRDRLILFAGRIVESKGIADFIAACAAALPQLPGWSAAIIGGDRFGPNSSETRYVAAMRTAAISAGIAFAGYQTHATVLTAMARAAIVVVPSRWPEPFGLTALEAMASGAALIATNTGGLPEVIGDAGMMIPPGDSSALTGAIIHLATDGAARIALAANGRVRAAGFDTAIIAARLEALRAEKTPL
ncbi:glycosyltransferase family 4 protein [Acidiphilium sp.]|uniref:glycosyltransferase family 4 protein n=1 Tax=Acidiphilium sp. TaxID=527 RepID=UPI003D07E2ED